MAAADGARIAIVGWDTYDEQVLRDWLMACVHAAGPPPGTALPARSASWADGSSRATVPDRGMSGFRVALDESMSSLSGASEMRRWVRSDEDVPFGWRQGAAGGRARRVGKGSA